MSQTNKSSGMNDVTRVLSAIEQGDPQAAEQLLPLVYDELRKLAAQKLAQEKPGQTLQATALVHEAYLRLVARRTRAGAAAAISSPRPPRPCAASWSRTPGARPARSRRRLDRVELGPDRDRRRSSGPTTSSPWTRPSAGSHRRTPQTAELVKLRLLRRAEQQAGGRGAGHLAADRRLPTGRSRGPGSSRSRGRVGVTAAPKRNLGALLNPLRNSAADLALSCRGPRRTIP